MDIRFTKEVVMMCFAAWLVGFLIGLPIII